MTRAYVDPAEFIEKRAKAQPDAPHRLNFAKVSTYERMKAARIKDQNEHRRPFSFDNTPDYPDYEQLAPGDPEDTIRRYDPNAQTSAAHAEKSAYDARREAVRTLEKLGGQLPDSARKELEFIAAHGYAQEAETGFSKFASFLEVLDKPRQLLTTAVADVFSLDEKVGGEITLGDYWDLLSSNPEKIVARHTAAGDLEMVSALGLDEQFAIEGQKFLQAAGAFTYGEEAGEGEEWGEKFWQTLAGLGVDVLLDPLTYVSFGTAAVGRKAAIEATTAVAVGSSKGGLKAGWKGAAVHLLEGGKADDLTGVARRAADLIDDRVAREAGEATTELTERFVKVKGRANKGRITPRERAAIESTARERVLAEELRMIELVEGESLTKVSGLLDELGGLGDDVVFGTAFEQEVSQMAKLQANKQYQIFAQQFPEYLAEMPKWAQGGLKLALPLWRRSMPMVQIGPRFNGPGQKLIARIMDKLPAGTTAWLRNTSERLSSTRQFLNRAKAYDIDQAKSVSKYFWADGVVPNHAMIGDVGVKLQGVVGELRHGITEALEVGGKAGLSKADVNNALRHLIDESVDQADVLAGLPPNVQSDLVDTAAGIRNTLHSIHSAAQEVGMPIGQLDNYIPLISNEPFLQVIRKLGDSGGAVRFTTTIDDPELRLGLELISEFVGSARGKGRALRNLGESVHAKSRTATTKFVSEAPEVTLLDNSMLDDLLASANVVAYDHDTLNRSVSKALDHLGEQGKLTPKEIKAVGGLPYKTDLADVLDRYVTSMTTAIQVRDSARVFRKAGLLVKRPARVSVTATLKNVDKTINPGHHPTMRFLDDLALSVEKGAAFAVDAKAAAKVVVPIGDGWTLAVPAALTNTTPFIRIRQNLSSAYKRVGRNLREAEAVVAQHRNRLLSVGVPDEIASRVALVEADTEFVELLADLRRLGNEQAAELEQLALEQVAANAHRMDPKIAAEQLRRAAKEAEQIRLGVIDTIAEHERNLFKQLKVPVGTHPQTHFDDLAGAAAPDNSGRSFFQWLADEGEKFLNEEQLRRWKPLEDLSEEGLADAAAAVAPELGTRAHLSLMDNLNVVDLSIEDLVRFSGPERAAETLLVLANRLDEAAMLSEDLLSPALREAAENVKEARFFLDNVRAGGLAEGTVKGAEILVRETRKVLQEASQELVGSPMRLESFVGRLADDVTDLTSDLLFDPEFVDVWAAAMHKLPNQNKSEFAKSMKAQGVDSIGQKELFHNGGKEAMREAAYNQIGYWRAMPDVALGNAGYAPLSLFETDTLLKAVDSLRMGGSGAGFHKVWDEARKLDRPLFEREYDFLLKQVWPQLDGRIVVRPSGQIGFERIVDAPLWATVDSVLPDLRLIIPNADELPIHELVGTAFDMFSRDAKVFDGVSDRLGDFMRSLDNAGGMDWDGELYDYLATFATELKTTSTGLRNEARRAVSAGTRLAGRQERIALAVTGLDEVLDTVNKAASGAGVGEKRLTQIWEKNAALIDKELGGAIADRARTLVEYTVAVRHTKLPKAVLDKQVALRRHLWVPLEEATARFEDDVARLLDEAVYTGNAELQAAAKNIRHFQEALVRLNAFGDDTSRGLREGFENLVPVKGEFTEALTEAKELGRKAVASAENIAETDPDFLVGIFPIKKGQTVQAWAKQTRKRINNWTPQEVSVATREGFVDLSLGGVAGDVFEDVISDRQIAIVLENMAGHLAALNTAEGIVALADQARAVEKYWRASATVARPAFVPRNLMSGLFNGSIVGAGVVHYDFTARRVMRPLIRIGNGTSTWTEEISKAPLKVAGYLHGLQQSRVLEGGFARSQLAHLKPKPSWGKRLNPLSYENEIFRQGGTLMETSENFLRAAAFIANYDPTRPATMRTARAMTLAAHFDYKNLTKVESGIKKLAPFFVWTRNNVPLQIRTMIEKPALINKYRHLVSNIDQVWGDDIERVGNQYGSALKASLGFTLGEDSAYPAYGVFDPDLPFRDIEEMLGSMDDGVGGLADWALQSLSPVYSAPLDFVTADNDYLVEAPTGLAPLFKLLPGTETTALGGTLITPRVASLVRTFLPQLGEYAETLGVVPSSRNAAQRLGYQTEFPIEPMDRVLGGARRFGKALGLTADIPYDAERAADQAIFDVIDGIKTDAAYSGTIRSEDMDEVIEAILRRAGVEPALAP